MTNSQSYPIIKLPYLYKYGLKIQNSTISPQTKLSVLSGFCRDVNNVVDIDLGDRNPNLEGNITSAPIRIDNTINGVGGLAGGETVLPNTMYAIYIVFDSRNYLPVSALATYGLNVYAIPGPWMPAGYDSWRFIGYWPTDNSGYWKTGYYFGQGSDITFIYDTPVITTVAAGSSTSFALVNLDGLVPLVSNIPVSLFTVFTPGVAGDTLSLSGGNSSSSVGQAVITGQVASVNVTSMSSVLAQNVTITNFLVPCIQYKVSGADTVAIYVAGFSISGVSFQAV